MPTYDYVCDGCGHAFELFQSMSDAVKKTCPKCKKKKLRRLIGAGGAIVFKGTGFYKTDYRSESYKKGAAADSGGAVATAAARRERASPRPAGARPRRGAMPSRLSQHSLCDKQGGDRPQKLVPRPTVGSGPNGRVPSGAVHATVPRLRRRSESRHDAYGTLL